jgi:hypothetical protein
VIIIHRNQKIQHKNMVSSYNNKGVFRVDSLPFDHFGDDTATT